MADRTVADRRELERALRAEVRGEVDFSAGARALTTMDASNYRRVPDGVVAPYDAADVAAPAGPAPIEHGEEPDQVPEDD